MSSKKTNELMEERCEHGVHQALERGRHIRETEHVRIPAKLWGGGGVNRPVQNLAQTNVRTLSRQ